MAEEGERGATTSVTVGPKPNYRRCVGIFLLNRDNHVFVGQRADLGRPAWQMPQGGLDEGEDPVEGGLREMEEEIGTRRADLLKASTVWRAYDLPSPVAGAMWGGAYRGQTQLWIAYRFTGADGDIKLDGHHPEFRDWRWIDPQALVSLVVPFKRDVYRSVVEEFRAIWQPDAAAGSRQALGPES